MPDQYQTTLPAAPGSLEAFAEFIDRCCVDHEVPAEAVQDLQLAVDEACSNIIEHGYRGMDPGEITLALGFVPGQVSVELRDQGRAFDPGEIPPPDVHAPLEERQAGGLGWFLIQQLMEAVEYRRMEDGNRLRFSKRLDG